MRLQFHSFISIPRVITALGMTVLAFFVFSSCSESTEQKPPSKKSYSSSMRMNRLKARERSTSGLLKTKRDFGSPKSESPETALNQYMHLCEERGDSVPVDAHGNPLPRKKRHRYTKSDLRKMRRHIGIIAREMGANPKLFWIWARRESSYRPYKRHKLNPDRKAAWTAWRRFHHTPGRESHLKRIMRTSSAKDGTKDYWEAKAELHRIQTYKNNPTYEARGRWSTGYGLYGMQPIYHVKRWDEEAPPEILCDPIVATVVAVWAARDVQKKCVSLGYKGTYETVNRAYSSGHCDHRPGWAKYFRQRARGENLNPAHKARLGSAWPKATSDREELLAHMREVLDQDEERLARRKRAKRHLARN